MQVSIKSLILITIDHPKPNDLFVALNSGKQCSTMDFSEAYLQVALDDEIKTLQVIHSQKDLFRFNRLAFSMAKQANINRKKRGKRTSTKIVVINSMQTEDINSRIAY